MNILGWNYHLFFTLKLETYSSTLLDFPPLRARVKQGASFDAIIYPQQEGGSGRIASPVDLQIPADTKQKTCVQGCSHGMQWPGE